ncbi:hypothetical protein CB1_000218003 [Camelus ferus]|nr:hypothetical protein CB1_000218003 [Camelus ferus]
MAGSGLRASEEVGVPGSLCGFGPSTEGASGGFCSFETPPREVEAVPRPLESSSTSGEVTLARKVLEGLSRLYLDSGRAVSNSPVVTLTVTLSVTTMTYPSAK